MDIYPIKTDDDLTAALREIESLWGAAACTDAGDRLDILTTLVERYEEHRWPLSDVSDPVDVLLYAIDEGGHTRAELDILLGSYADPSDILGRRRPLSVEMIHAINQAWKIPAELLVRPIRVAA